MKKITNKNNLILGIIFAVLTSGVFWACSSDVDGVCDVATHDPRLMILEEKYNVKLDNNRDKILSELDYQEIEKKILKMKKDLESLKGKTYKLRNVNKRIKTRAIETVVSDSEHVFNAVWIKVYCSIEDNNNFSLSIGIDGITVYDSISLISQSNDYSSGASKVDFSFTLQAVAEVNTYVTEDYSGSADFTSKTVTFNKK